jgi:cytochrome P450
VLTDPDLAGAMLVTHAASFKKTRALQIARRTFGNGLVTSEGETWRRQQRLMRAYFTPRATATYAEAIAEAIARKLQTWQPRAIVDLHEDMVDVSMELVCRTLFGIDAGELQPLIRGAAKAVQQWHSDCQELCLPHPHYWPSLSNFRYRSKTAALDRAVYALIRRVRAEGSEGHGLLGAMLKLEPEDGIAVTDRDIRDQVVTLFLAGHETTAAAVGFTLYELSYRPDLQACIAEDARAGRDSETLERVLKESLRLYPTVHLVARTALKDVQLGQYLVKRGDEVVLPLYVMQRSPRLFERPDDFEPERWNDDATGQVFERYAYIPFSTGPRICIGQALAMAELRAIVRAVLSRFRLEPLGARTPQIDARMTLGPAAGSTRVRVVPTS